MDTRTPEEIAGRIIAQWADVLFSQIARAMREAVDVAVVAEREARDAAIAAERERCAKIAEDQARFRRSASAMGLPVEPSPIIAADRAREAEIIAAAIRRGSDDA